MLLELIIALIIGILAGTITGLIPGLHINLIGTILVSLTTTILSPILPLYLVVFIVAMAITHTFVDFIPSIFLGCPDTDTELSVLPGHELLLEGKGHEAVTISTYGSLIAIFILLLISIPSIILIPKIYEKIVNITPYFLILISLTLILLENQKTKALFVFSITGLLGLIVLNSEIKEPLLPLLTGLFGSSTLLISIKNKTLIPKQELCKKIKVDFIKPTIGAMIASPLCSFLPGLGSGQAAIIGNQISKMKKEDKKGFIFLLGITNTLVMGFSFISLYTISKTRTGAASAIQQLINPDKKILLLILTITTVTGLISFFLTKKLSEIISQKIEKINYALLSLLTLIFLIILITFFSGLTGLLILIISTLTGIFCISLGVRRTNLMGCLLIPTILFYLL